MKRIIEWLKASNRWKHLLGGFIIGLFSFGWFTALYSGVLTAGALEYKDKSHGGQWDWIDFGLTVAGTCLGCLISVFLT